MRYCLRTLLIVLALGPMVLAGLWLAGERIASGISLAMALVVAIGVSLYTLAGFVMFIAAVRLVDLIAESLVRQKRR